MDPLTIFFVFFGALAATYGIVTTASRFFHPARLALLIMGLGAVIWAFQRQEPAVGPLSGLSNGIAELANVVVLIAGILAGRAVAKNDPA